MAQDRPTASELLAAIADFLREEAMPALDHANPRLGFQIRVAVNSLAILEREARLGPAADRREHERLVKLLGREGTSTSSTASWPANCAPENATKAMPP